MHPNAGGMTQMTEGDLAKGDKGQRQLLYPLVTWY